MNEQQLEFMNRLNKSIDLQLSNGNIELVSCLSRILKYLPDNVAGALAAAIEDGMDSYLIEELKLTFSV